MSYSLETASAASVTAPLEPTAAKREDVGARTRVLARRVPRPELLALLALAGVLNLWSLSRNGLANDYYAAAVRSMSTSWHDFLFASLDHSGVMTVDKPPLALWIQALSVRIFGFHSLSILVPQALMGMASVVLLYDLVRRRFGRIGGAVAGLTLALTPITVAISRHNNPDALLVLCSIAALWFAVRALEDPRTRWLVGAGVCVGLGFETKMGVAFAVVPGIVAAWLWLRPAGRGRLHALRQLLGGGAAMVLVGGTWPALVELTPAGDRPWVSGTSDNRVLSLIFEYNGLGRVDGQAGGPGGIGGGSVFGGSTGPLRLLNSALGGQAGWLLGFALVSALAILASSRLRRVDWRSGWLMMVGGAFVLTALLFSFASGIFHPYYVSLLAPFAAALVGAGVAQLIGGAVKVRVFGPLAVAGGVASELIVLGDYQGQLTWLAPLLIVVGLLASIALLAFGERLVRMAAVGAAMVVLMVAPAAWAFDTLGHATNGTFPEGGPSGVMASGGLGGPGAGRGLLRGGPPGVTGASGSGRGQTPPLFGPGGPSGAAGPIEGTVPGAGGSSPRGASIGVGPPGGGVAGGRGGIGGAPGGFGGALSKQVLSYVKSHGGGTIAVSSQSGAASSILSSGANVAGIGGFSGRESNVGISWLAQEVRTGKIRWVLDEGGSGFGGGPGGDGRKGSQAAMAAVAKACVAVTLPEAASTRGGFASASSSGTMYDCGGRAAQLARLDA